MVSLRLLLPALLLVVLGAPAASAAPWNGLSGAIVPSVATSGAEVGTEGSDAEISVARPAPVAPPARAAAPATPDVPRAFDAALSHAGGAATSGIETLASLVPAEDGVGSLDVARIPARLHPGDAHATVADDAGGARTPDAPTATTAVGGLALVWLVFEKLGLARALVALYFRVQPGELLENERRERVVTLVRERPGIGPTDIAQALGTGWGVTSYHLDRLERAGLVASQRVGHHRCYFLPGAVPREQQRTVGLFRADTTRRVAQLVAKCPGIAQSQLCHELGLSASAASKQLSRLEAASLVRREASGGALRIFPTATLSTVV